MSFKIISELILKLLLANGFENQSSGAFARSIAVVVIVVFAMGLLHYSEVMLNVSKVRSITEITKPTHDLELRLESCNSMIVLKDMELKILRIKLDDK